MEARDQFPDKVPGPEWKPVSGPGLDDMLMPNLPVTDRIPRQPPDLNILNREVDDITDAAADLDEKLVRIARQHSDPVIEAAEQIKAQLHGTGANLLDSIDQTVDRIKAKLVARSARKMGEVYELILGMGFDIPSMEQVQYGNQTGDYIGSVTLGPSLAGERPSSDGFEHSADAILAGMPTFSPSAVSQTLPATNQPSQELQQPPQVIVVPIGSLPNDRLCPPGYSVIGIQDGQVTCYLHEPPPEPLPPPPIPIATPYKPPLDKPPGEPKPPGVTPPPTMVVPPAGSPDPVTCEYPPSPTTKVGCGKAPPPARKPPPFWVVVWCDGCGWEWCSYVGDRPPAVEAHQTLHGPFSSMPDIGRLTAGMCKVKVDGDDEDEDEDEDEENGEDDIDDVTEPVDEPNGDGVPPVPPPVVPPPAQPAPPGKDKYCQFIESAPAAMADINPSFDVVVGIAPADTVLGRLVNQVFRANLTLVMSLFPATITGILKWARTEVQKFANGLACDRDKMIPHEIAHAGVKFIQRLFGIVPHQTTNVMKQASNTICQSEIPGGEATDVAYLRGTINLETWECYHKANGNYLEPARKIMEAQRAKPDPSQLDLLFRRGYIQKTEYDKLIREAGVIKDEDKKNIHNLNDIWPQGADAVRFMQRDVADEITVDWREVDEVFRKKHVGRVRKYTEALGLTDAVMLDYWRAHFHIPSYTMGQQFFFRQRPGKQGVDKPFTRPMFRNMLIQDDWHPAFIDWMIDTAYRPVTVTDATRAFMIHSATEEELEGVFLDNGREPQAAKFMVRYWKRRREVQDKRQNGYPTVRMLVNQYARCEITNKQFRDTLARIVITEEQEKAALEASVLSREVRQRKDAIAAVRKPFVLGLLDEAEARQELNDREIDGACIEAFIATWTLMRIRRDKHENAGQLCGMMERGIVGPEQFVRALVRGGWDADAAIRIAQNCSALISEKQARRAETLARRTASEIKKLEKEQARQRRLMECGPPACPTNTPGGVRPSAVRPQTPGQTSGGTVPTSPTVQPAPSGQTVQKPLEQLK